MASFSILDSFSLFDKACTAGYRLNQLMSARH